MQASASVLGVSSAIKRPRVPTFVTLPAVPSTWKGLQSVIPTILTYGIIGYPFIMPGAVGGDYDEEVRPAALSPKSLGLRRQA